MAAHKLVLCRRVVLLLDQPPSARRLRLHRRVLHVLNLVLRTDGSGPVNQTTGGGFYGSLLANRRWWARELQAETAAMQQELQMALAARRLALPRRCEAKASWRRGAMNRTAPPRARRPARGALRSVAPASSRPRSAAPRPPRPRARR